MLCMCISVVLITVKVVGLYKSSKVVMCFCRRCGIVVESDSESRGSGFDPHRRNRFVSLSKTH